MVERTLKIKRRTEAQAEVLYVGHFKRKHSLGKLIM